jgi:hypothetical protein
MAITDEVLNELLGTSENSFLETAILKKTNETISVAFWN